MYLNDCKAIMRFSDVEDTSLNGRRRRRRPVNASGEKTKHGKIKNKNKNRPAPKAYNKGTGSKPPAPVYTDFHGDSTESLRPSCAYNILNARTYIRTYDSRNTWLCDCNQRCTDSIAQLVYYVTPNVVDTLACDMTTRDKRRVERFTLPCVASREYFQLRSLGNQVPTFLSASRDFTSTDAIVDIARDGKR